MSLLDLLSKDVETSEPAKATASEPKKAALVPRALLNKKVAKVTKASPATSKSSTSVPIAPRITNASLSSAEAKQDPESAPQPPIIAGDDLMVFHTISDLYDPSTPNDYYEIVYKPRKEQISREETDQRERQAHESMDIDRTAFGSGEQSRDTASASLQFGAKMLYKQGWKGAGFGLGKDDQGISTPLIGVEAGAVSVDGTMKNTGAISRAPMLLENSRVLCLRNMVGKGQVDVDLRSETFSECSGFGEVLHCVIAEQDAHIPCKDDEAVRIFVQFSLAATAEKARFALNGRSFGGRVVIATHYPEAAFSERKYWLPIHPSKT